MIIISGENKWGITKETSEVLPISNQEETNTRLIFHVAMSSEAAVIVAKGTDVFLLLAYALAQIECIPAIVYED